MARQYARRWPSIEETDLVSTGNEAVAVLERHFDITRETDFDGFVFKRVRGAMYDHARRVFRDSMQESASVAELAETMGAADPAESAEDFTNPNAPTPRELVVDGLEKRAAGLLCGLRGRTEEIDEDAVIGAVDRARQKRDLALALEEIDEHMRAFICARYFEGMTLERAGHALGVTLRTAQRIDDRACKWLLAWFRRAAKRPRTA
jgi:RNA polymerase sigma factor (sigma-70 family)